MSAPELRRQKNTAEAHNVQLDPNNESPTHDPDVLPHDYGCNDMGKIFAKATVPDDEENAPASRCMCGRPECRQCFPPPPPEFGPPIRGAEVWMLKRYPRRLADM